MDLEELLSKDWITRLWTYQEILLASNPILVCGDWHISWSTFERSVLFLDDILFFNPEGIMRPWTSVVLSRERLQTSGLASSCSEASALDSYIIFVRKISKAHWMIYLSYLAFVVPLFAFLLILALDLANPEQLSETASKYVKASVAIISFVLLFVIITTGRSHLRNTTTSEGLFMIEDIVVGLYSRTATEPKDMAFGVWAVLERGGAVNLPAPIYSHDTGDVHRIFTIHLAHITQSLELLLLAAIRGVSGQPSWVPDWSAHKSHE
jgi:hypothetical protein